MNFFSLKNEATEKQEYIYVGTYFQRQSATLWYSALDLYTLPNLCQSIFQNAAQTGWYHRHVSLLDTLGIYIITGLLFYICLFITRKRYRLKHMQIHVAYYINRSTFNIFSQLWPNDQNVRFPRTRVDLTSRCYGTGEAILVCVTFVKCMTTIPRIYLSCE